MDKISDDVIHSGIWGTVALVVLSIFLFFILHTCDASRTAYYDAQKKCIESGGSWVARNNGDSDCLRLGGRS